MSKIVFDIETVGIDFDKLPANEQAYLLKDAKDEKEKEKIKKSTGLWPLISQVVAICLLNPDTEKGKIYYQDAISPQPFIEDGIEYEAMGEKEILTRFWQDIRNYQQYVTFNGRQFDCPYLMLRSAILKVKPTRNLMPYRYSDEQHIDLLDQLTFYGAFRRFSLDFYANYFNLKNRKTDGMSGDKVGEYFKEGRYKEIARYCAADVRATAELYERWKKYVRT